MATVAVAGWIYQAQTMPSPQQCTGAQGQLAQVWDAQRRAQIREVVLGVERPYVPQVWARTATQLDGYVSDWQQMYTEVCAATTLRGEQSVAVMDLRMQCLQRAKVELQAEAKAERRAGHNTAALARVEAAAHELVGIAYQPVQIQRALVQGEVLDRVGRYEAAEVALREALELASRWHQLDEMQRAASSLMFVVGYRLHKGADGLRYRELAQGLARGKPMLEAESSTELGYVLERQGKFVEAEREQRRALDLRLRLRGPEHSLVATARNGVATALFGQGKFHEAELEYRQALAVWERTLGSEHPAVVVALSNLASTLARQGKHVQGEVQQRRALDIALRAYGPEHPIVASARNNLGATVAGQGRYVEAEAIARESLAQRRKLFGDDHPEVATSLGNVANALLGQRNFAAAQQVYRRALDMRLRVQGAEHPDVAMARNALAVGLERRGMFGQAEAELRLAVSIWKATLGAEHPEVAVARGNLARTLAAQGRDEEAEAQRRAALTAREPAVGPEHLELAGLRHGLASILLKRGATDEALRLAEQAWRRRELDDARPTQAADTAFLLAQALTAAKRDPDRARGLAERALKVYSSVRNPNAKDIAAVEQWLARGRVSHAAKRK